MPGLKDVARAAVLAGACAAIASAQAAPKGKDVCGQVSYLPDGVRVAGRRYAWKELRSLQDLPPDRDALGDEFEARRQKRPDDVASHLKLAAWARSSGLADAAQTEDEAALALDPENVDARKALGWVREAGTWRRVSDVLAEKLQALPAKALAERLDLAAWCGDNGDPEDRWQLLVDVAVADPLNKRMLALIKPLLEQREQHTVLTPPLAGTWRAEVDKSGHHQAKAYAIHAIDFTRVGPDGRLSRGAGKRLEDYYGFDSLILAAADGTVRMVEDGFPDLPPGTAGDFDEANSIGIEHAAHEWTDYGQIRQGSALVHEGDVVKAGQPIARVGNSGASGMPHLHFTLDMPVFASSGEGDWLSIPWRLDGFRVVEADGDACDFAVKSARVQEGWRMEFPDRE